MMTAFAPVNNWDTGSGPQNGLGATLPHPSPSRALCGPQSAPAELLCFVRARSVGEVAQALGMARGTVHRLRNGYWPSDPRKIMQAWSDYKGRAAVASSWFLRRVRPGGVVRHGGRAYTGQQLAARTGELLAVARAADGGLLAQTLDMPPQRLPLAPLDAAAGGIA